MVKNLKRYYQAWELRQQGKTFKEIRVVMKVSKSYKVNRILGTLAQFVINYN